MITVRPAQFTDVAAMSVVLVASIRELCVMDHRDDADLLASWLRNKSPEMVTRMLSNPNAEFFVAERFQEVAAVGCINLPGEIGLNYVGPKHRWAGVSKALLAGMEYRLTERGVTTARLTSTATAHRFYLAAGWVDVGPATIDFGMPGYPMEKALSDKHREIGLSGWLES